MRLYAQTPARRGRQLIADLIALLLIAITVKFALVVRDAILTLAEPGRKAESAGDNLASGLDDAGDAASKVPFVGDSLKKPLKSAAEAGTSLSDAGQSLQDTVGHVATLTTIALIALPTAVSWRCGSFHGCDGSGAAPPPVAFSIPPVAPTSSRCVRLPGRSGRWPRFPRRREAWPTPGVAETRTSSPTCRR
jgi:hypothetical protein